MEVSRRTTIKTSEHRVAKKTPADLRIEPENDVSLAAPPSSSVLLVVSSVVLLSAVKFFTIFFPYANGSETDDQAPFFFAAYSHYNIFLTG